MVPDLPKIESALFSFVPLTVTTELPSIVQLPVKLPFFPDNSTVLPLLMETNPEPKIDVSKVPLTPCKSREVVSPNRIFASSLIALTLCRVSLWLDPVKSKVPANPAFSLRITEFLFSPFKVMVALPPMLASSVTSKRPKF